jgi:glycosyltransferase involved in cell wall biosynthesis
MFMEARPLMSYRQRAAALYRRAVLPLAVTKADWIIAISETTRDRLVALFPDSPEKLSVIGTPVSMEYFRIGGESLVSQKRKPLAPYLIAFGGIDPRKNVARVIRGFLDARRVIPSLELVILGSQGGHKELTDSANGIRALGYVEETELVELYRSARGLLYPSLSEGYGVPIIEAMAAGVPVVTSNREPMRGLAGDAALIVDPEDTRSITRAVVELTMNDEVFDRCSQVGRSHAQQFSPEKIARQVMAVYSHVVATSSAREPPVR